MQKRKHFVLAALTCYGIMLGGFNGLRRVEAQYQPTNQPAPGNNMQDMAVNSIAQSLSLPAGFLQKEAKDANRIKSELATITTDALTKDHFSNLINNLAKPDEKRLADAKKIDVTALNTQIDQFRKNWQTRYGRDFKIDNKMTFDDRFLVMQGEVSDPITAMANWPAPALTGEAVKASQIQQPVETEKKAEKDAELEKGRDVALVRLPAGYEFPDITVSILHQVPFEWRADIPNDRTGSQVYDDLLRRISYLNEHDSQWPADVNDASRMVSQNVFGALYGVQTQPGMNAMP